MKRKIYNGIPWYGQNGNTVNAHGVCVIQGDSAHMFHEQACATISLTGEPGRICAHTDAEGMQTGRQVILTCQVKTGCCHVF